MFIITYLLSCANVNLPVCACHLVYVKPYALGGKIFVANFNLCPEAVGALYI